MRQATLSGIGRRWNRRKACFEPRSQLRAIEIAADQHELVGFFPVARILVQAEPLGDKMENVALVAFGGQCSSGAGKDAVVGGREGGIVYAIGAFPVVCNR